MPLPAAFCWTKFGVESGETPEAIFERKDRERLQNGGVFLWGIGNSIRPSLGPLLALTDEPEVIFTPMVSPAATIDVSPAQVVAWSTARAVDGRTYVMPPFSLVTSRTSTGRSSQRHYALVCHADRSLRSCDVPLETIDRSQVRNLRTGSAVGSSQVTSVVRIDGDAGEGPAYPVRIRARLVEPYFVELTDPQPI